MTNTDYQYDDHFSNKGDHDLKPIDFIKGNHDTSYDYNAMVAESEARVAANLESDDIILSRADLAKIEEIRHLHDTALARALRRDGHSKSSEGSLRLSLGNYWNRLDDDGNPTERPEVGVELYSYVLGPSRDHWFASIDRALETVRVWYAREMSLPGEYDPVVELETIAMFDGILDKITVIELTADDESTEETRP